MVERIAEGAARRLREDREGDPPVLDNFPAGEFDPDGPVKFWPNRIARGLPIGGGSGGAAWKAWVDPKSGKELAFWFVSDMGAPHHLDMAKALGITPPTYGGDEVLTGPLRVSGYGTSTDMGWMASYFANDLGVNKAELQRMEKVGNNLHKLIMDSVEEIPRRHRKDIKDANIMSITPAMAASGMLDDPRLLKALAKLQRQYEKVYRRAARRAAADFKAASVVTAAGGVLPEEIVKAAALVESFLVLTGVARRQLFREILDALLIIYGLDAEERAAELKAVAEYSKLLEQQVGVQAERLVAGVQDAAANVMLDSLHEGWSIPQTADKLQEKIEGIAPWQATMLARTDLIALANGASQQRAVVVNSPELQFKTWLATPDERTRIDHRHAHGQTVPITQPFTVGGEQLLYPGDPSASDGNVLNCRCTLIYGKDAFGPPGIKQIVMKDDLAVSAAGFVEAKHPRHPAGDERGGEFASKLERALANHSMALHGSQELMDAAAALMRGEEGEGPAFDAARTLMDAAQSGIDQHDGIVYRGSTWKRRSNPKVGEIIDAPLWSFAPRGDVAYNFAERAASRGGGKPVLYWLHDPKGIDVNRRVDTVFSDESEFLVSGKYRVAWSQREMYPVGYKTVPVLKVGLEPVEEDVQAAAWDESRHARQPAGTDRGGEFARKGTARGAGLEQEIQRQRAERAKTYGQGRMPDHFPMGIFEPGDSVKFWPNKIGTYMGEPVWKAFTSRDGDEVAFWFVDKYGKPYHSHMAAAIGSSIVEPANRGHLVSGHGMTADGIDEGQVAAQEIARRHRKDIRDAQQMVEGGMAAAAWVEVELREEDILGVLTAAGWVESKHPRHPKGSERGGEFAPADGVGVEDEPLAQGALADLGQGGPFSTDMPPGELDPEGTVTFWPRKIGHYDGEPYWKAITSRSGLEMAFWFVDQRGRPHHDTLAAALAGPGHDFQGIHGDWVTSAGTGDVQDGEGRDSEIVRRHRKDIDDARQMTKALAAAAWDPAKHPRHPAGSPEGGEFAPKGFYYGASIARGPNDEPIGYHAFRMERGKGRFYDYEAKAISDRGSTRAGPIRETLEEATRDAQAAYEAELDQNAAGAGVDWGPAEEEFNKWAEGLRPYYDDAAEFERLKADAWMSYENWVDRELPKLQARLNGAQVPGLTITPQLNPASDGDMDVALDPERAIDSGPDFTVELPAAEGGLPPSFTVWTYPEGANLRHQNDPDWFEQPEGVQVEEVLDILDTDFFPDGPDSDLAGDYARAVDAVRGVPDDPGFVTIYRGMTDAEYDDWVAGNEIPTGKWFAGIPTSQYAQDVSGQPPNLYSFRVPRNMLMQTGEHEYQLKRKGRMRNGVIEPTDAVRAAAWDESKHPRDPGGEGGGQWIHKGTTEADGPEKAAGFASRAEADEELKLRADWPQYDAMSDEELLNVQQRLSSRIHGNSLSGIQGIRELRRESGRGGYTPTPEEEAEWAKVEARYEAVNRHVAARRKAAEFAREGAARAEAESTGKLTIGKDELAEILGKQGDTYRDANYQGEYNPDLFITSDLSGRPIRHYVRLPDGRIGHPDEIHESRARGRIIVVPNFPAPRERARYRSDLLRQSVQAVRASGLEEALTALAGALSAAGFVEAQHPRHPAGTPEGGEFRAKNGSEVAHAEEPVDTSQHSTGPQGGRRRSIHDKLVISGGEITEPVSEAVRTIDATMHWPAVPGERALQIGPGKQGATNQGSLWRDDETLRPVRITIAPDSVNPISGIVHELAHYLDSLLGQDAWADPKYVGSDQGREVWFNYASSDAYGPLAPVLGAIKETDMYRNLADGAQGAEFQYGGRYFRPGPAHVQYMMKPEELVARSFEQYIATKNPGSRIARTPRHVFSQQANLFPPEYPGYLKGPDLERVNAAWERVLEERGLLKKRGFAPPPTIDSAAADEYEARRRKLQAMQTS